MMPTLRRQVDVALPQGTITFLFTDIQGSTRLLERLGPVYGDVLSTHGRLLREAAAHHGGVEVDTQGDAFFLAFADPADAVAAAVDAQRRLLGHPWPHGEPVLVRMGLHTGTASIVDGGYVGIDVHRAARIAGVAHGGQVVVSSETCELLRAAGVDGVTFRSLGEHLLKDIDEPEHIHQVEAPGLRTSFPPLTSLPPPTNIPRRAGDLVGRERELTRLGDLLADPAVRLVTITGTGGVGKTRVAAAAALEALDRFPAGGYFVDLSALERPEQVPLAIGRELGLDLDGAQPVLEALPARIGGRRMLLVLDNFEQVQAATPAVAELLRSCPRLTLLVTSRSVLGLADETACPLQPLGQDDAVHLFLARARAARAGVQLTDANAATIAAICSLLDGLPLALELAAARLKLFSLDDLRRRLDDRLGVLTGGPVDAPERHQAIRITIDWSYGLLPAPAQALFRRMAVFRGAVPLDAIDAVVGLDCLEDVLPGLLDHSLVRSVEEDGGGALRFSLLALLRHYGLEQLATDPEREAVLERHARHYAALAEDGDPQSLKAEQQDVDAALSWLLDAAEQGNDELAQLAQRTAAALGPFWYHHGDAREAAALLERALAAAPTAAPVERATALRWAGVLLEHQRRLEPARARFEEALGLFVAEGDTAGEAACLNSLGVVARSTGDLDAAADFFRRSLELRRALGDDDGVATTTSNLALVLIDGDELARGVALLEEADRLDRASGDDWAIACTANNLGVARLLGGHVGEAGALITDALRRFAAAGDLDGVAESIEALTGVAAAEGAWVRAAHLAGSAGSVRDRAGIPATPLDRSRLERWLDGPRTALGDAAFAAARAEGAAMTGDQAVRHALGESTTALS
jgi:predicted ATPase/class 3 adenylate cyclase